MINATRVRQWISVAAQLKGVKKQEMDLRKEIVAGVMAGQITGTVKTVLDEALELKAVIGTTLSLKRTDVLPHIGSLTETEKGAIIWEPKISKKAYDKLPEDSLLRRLVTKKPSSPTLEAIDLEVK